MVIDKSSTYLNLWIIDPTVCMMTDKIAGCLFALSVLIYLRSLMRILVDILFKLAELAVELIKLSVYLVELVADILHGIGIVNACVEKRLEWGKHDLSSRDKICDCFKRCIYCFNSCGFLSV